MSVENILWLRALRQLPAVVTGDDMTDAIEPSGLHGGQNRCLTAKARSHLGYRTFVPAGGVYLKRLVMLLLERANALKSFLVVAPTLHTPTASCGSAEQQRQVTGPWALAVSRLIAEVRPDIPPALLESRLNPLAYRCACGECRTAIQDRIRRLAVEWIGVRVRYYDKHVARDMPC